MSNCKQCGADIELKEGRRPREFCDNKGKCRNLFHRKLTKDKIDDSELTRVKEEFEKYKSETKEKLLKLTMSHSNTANTAGNKKDRESSQKGEEGLKLHENDAEARMLLAKMKFEGLSRKSRTDVSEMINSIPPVPKREDILKEIEEIKAESIPKERDTTLGRKVWLNDQRKRIAELEKLLH